MSEQTTIDTLLAIMARLRDPQHGCPWDLEQDFESIAPYTIEEAYEVTDAIVHGDMEALRDELGDLLFQVVFHARMAQECGAFDFQQVVRGIVEKMVRRHPHVFSDASAEGAEQVKRSWEAIKVAERERAGKRRDSVLDGVAAGMPAMVRAVKLQRRAAQQGFDWPDAGAVIAKVREETGELESELAAPGAPAAQARVAAELGDLLFTVVNLARHLHVDPELALAGANARFEARFRHVEAHARDDADPRPLHARSDDELDAMWRAAKRALRLDEG